MSEARLYNNHLSDDFDLISQQLEADTNRQAAARQSADVIPREPRWGRAMVDYIPPRPLHFDTTLEMTLSDFGLSKDEVAEIDESLDDFRSTLSVRENLRLGVRDVFMVPDGEDGIQHMLALPISIAEETKQIVAGTVEAFRSVAEQAEVTPRKVIATGVAAGVLATGSVVTNRSNETVEATAEPSGIAFYRTSEATVINVGDISSEEEEKSLHDVARVLGEERSAVHLEGSELYLPAELPENMAFAAYMAFRAPDTVILPGTEVLPAPSQPAEVTPIEPAISPEAMTDSEYITWLADQAKPTAAEYATFDVDTSYEDAFKDELSGDSIQPTAFVGHWTAGTYTRGVEQFISAIKSRDGNCCSVMYFMDKDAKVYRFTDSDEKTAHARGANDFTQGVEIEADDLRGYTPEQMKTFIYLAYRFMTANDIPLERSNFLGHAEVDAEHGGSGKIDMPSELVDLLFPKLQALAAEIAGNAATAPVAPATPEVGNSQERYDQAMHTFLDEIASHEGGWDSVNTGKAGDTKVGGERYNQIFGGRLLSELTVQEILDLQAAGTIFAVGRYQMIDTTFAAAVDELGIDTSRKFDQALQNEVAINYLILGSKRPALAKYLNGESDDRDAAMLAAAQEWASFPCPDSYNDRKGRLHGSGFYDGDSAGNNAAGGSSRVDEIGGQMDEIRAAKIAMNQPAPDPVAPPAPRTMVMMGDSLTHGYDQIGKIQDIDQDFGLEVTKIDAVVGRSLEAGANNGMSAIEAMQAEIDDADIAFFGYGTNAAGSDEHYEDDLLDIIGRFQDDNTRVVIPRIYSETRSRDSRNEIIDRVAAQTGATVIDVADTAELGRDSVHPTNYAAIARRILDEVSKTSYLPVAPTDPVPTTSAAPVVPPTTTVTDRLEEGSLSSVLWFDEVMARSIYSAYISDPAKLDLWMSTVPTKEEDGQIKYQVSMKNIPNITEGDQ